MGYIQNREHFVNYLCRVAKDSGIDPDEMYPLQFYVEEIWNAGIADDFTWALRNSAEWLTRPRVREFLQRGFSQEFAWPLNWPTLDTSGEFDALLLSAHRRSGVYFFESYDGTALYVGRSVTCVGTRMAQSFADRFRNVNEQIFGKIMFCDASDASLLEVYYITVLKPVFNRDCKYEDSLNVTVRDIPACGERVGCFHVYDQ